VIKLITLLCLTSLASCSSTQFQSSKKASINFDKITTEENENIAIEVSKSFYMWGNFPKVQTINVGAEFNEKGYEKVSNLEIKEIDVLSKGVWMFMTMGMYYPQTFKFTGKVSSTN